MDQEILNQIERIKTKLFLAKDVDKDFEIFGADCHEYVLGKTVNEAEILEFEKVHALSLPESYKAFLMHLGNGGNSYQNSAAGPDYGIFPFGENLEEFVYTNPGKSLSQDCKIYPNMSNEFWEELNRRIDDDAISDVDYDAELIKIFSGILPISSQGCTYYSGLVLNGDFKGRVVNIDIDRQKPHFAFESNFLDWYERWLDQIIAETSIEYHDLFNYTLSGNPKHILEVYSATDDKETKLECLSGILKKKEINPEVLDILEKENKSVDNEIQRSVLQILTKFDYNRAYPHLVDFAMQDLLTVFQFVFWYAKDKSTDWLAVIKENVSEINDDEAFRFCTYLLKEMNMDYSSIIIPFTADLNEEIRVTAYYSLGQLENKKDYLETFITGLNDKSNRVVHTTLQALNGIYDKKLLVYYKNIAERFPVEQDYILVNLNHRLKDYNLSNTSILNIDIENFESSSQKDKKKWFRFWE